jgi:hypothetical protein
MLMKLLNQNKKVPKGRRMTKSARKIKPFINEISNFDYSRPRDIKRHTISHPRMTVKDIIK